MLNALSIDLEDWFCAYNLRIPAAEWHTRELRVVANTRRILDLLDRHQTHATFFVLGWMADKVPDLVREVEARGHEIATHGYSHTVLTAMTPETFERDLGRALEATQVCIHQPILGFRAPSFTVTRRTLWALEILARRGLAYDSSIFPISNHPDYGIPDAPLGIHPRGAITEVPMSVVRVLGRNVPCSGGGYFRVFPYRLTRFLLRRINHEGRPAVFYVHPWEVDPGQPRVEMSPAKKFRHYINLDKTLARLDHLLSDFQFAPIRQLLGI